MSVPVQLTRHVYLKKILGEGSTFQVLHALFMEGLRVDEAQWHVLALFATPGTIADVGKEYGTFPGFEALITEAERLHLLAGPGESHDLLKMKTSRCLSGEGGAWQS